MSKFLTWTKGDRRNFPDGLQSGGVVPIPVECISFKGLDVSRTAKNSSKANRKPLPLDLHHLSRQPSNDKDSKGNSIALHDAAVQSATNLMAVMSDMLRSPHLSAHLQQRSASLQPMHGRPRSHTAPPTPLVEAPLREPVELPGSLLLGQKSLEALGPDPMVKESETLLRSQYAFIGQSIERPHTSPQESTYPSARHSRKPSEIDLSRPNFSLSSDTVASDLVTSPRLVGDSVTQRAGLNPSGYIITNPDEEETLVAHESTLTNSSLRRPSVYMLQPQLGRDSNIASLQTDALKSSHPPCTPRVVDSTVHMEMKENADTETMLFEQIAMLRNSHEAHLATLRKAHESELASQRSYINFLEKWRPRLNPHSTSTSRQQLTIDTSKIAVTSTKMLTPDASATTLHSFDSSIDSQKRTSHETDTADIDLLRRKLSLAQKAQVESGEIRRERDHLRDGLDRSERRIVQLKDIVRKAKENEKALRNATDDLESRLIAANNERVDALDGYHTTHDNIRSLEATNAALNREVQDLRARMFYTNGSYASLSSTTSDNTHDRRRHSRARSDLNHSSWNADPLISRVNDLQRQLAEKDARVKRLEEEAWRPSQLDQVSATAMVAKLQQQLSEQTQALTSAQTDRDRYDALLRAEMRKKSRLAAQRTQTPSMQAIEPEAIATFRDQLSQQRSESSVSASRHVIHQDSTTTILERELNYCLREIIMYKLDIHGYKKDLKRAHSELDSLRAVPIRRPPTPDQGTSSSSSIASCNRPSTGANFDHQGLGIHALPPGSSDQQQPPGTPTRTIAAATEAALLALTPPAPPFSFPPPPPPPPFPPQEQSTTLSNPPLRPRTPLGTHKKLPKPPSSRTPSPMPQQHHIFQRVETMRSLSESIISSYARRSPPEGETQGEGEWLHGDGNGNGNREEGRRSDPIRQTSTLALG